MRAAKVQASLRMRAVSQEPPLLAHTSSESRGTFRQKARSLAPLNAWACAVKICNDGMLEDTDSLDGAHLSMCHSSKHINQDSALRWHKMSTHQKDQNFFLFFFFFFSSCNDSLIFYRASAESLFVLLVVQTTNYGECTSPALSLTNLGIYVGFHLKIDWSQSRIIEREAITLSKEDGMKTLRSFMRVFGLKKCNFCELHLRMDKEKQTNEPLGDLVIWTTFHTNANCQLENVYTQVRKVTSTQITVATGNKTLQLTMQLETRSLETIISENVTDYICAEFGYTSRRCYTRLRIIQTPCPAIELVIKEFMNIFDEKQGKSTNSIRRVAATDIVLVCVDKYFSVMKRIRSSAEHTEVSLSVFLLAAVMCFV